jgi:hypothetical protein
MARTGKPLPGSRVFRYTPRLACWMDRTRLN